MSPRYEPLVKLASGGMATVFVGAARGALGFRQIVAIKRPHPHLVEDPAYREALLAEARVASRVHHANVVDVRDVEVDGDTLQLVMDYVEGASLGQLILHGAKTGARIPPAVAVRIVLDACAGLHAAHELTDEAGAPLGLVHRDVSPQNILVGLDGVARVADFGVAKEARAVRATTTEGALKGKIGYIAPEYVRGQPIDRRADVFAMGVVLWEALAHKRLFRGSNEAEALDLVLREAAPPASRYAPEVGPALDAVIARAVEKSPGDRFATARDLGAAIERAARAEGLAASPAEVARAVEIAVGDELAERRRAVRARLAAIEIEAKAKVEAEPAAPVISASPPPLRSAVPAPSPRGRVVGIAAVTLAVVVGASWSRIRGADTTRVPIALSAIAPAISIAPAIASSIAPSAASAPTPPDAPPSASAARSASPPPRRGPRPFPANPYR